LESTPLYQKRAPMELAAGLTSGFACGQKPALRSLAIGGLGRLRAEASASNAGSERRTISTAGAASSLRPCCASLAARTALVYEAQGVSLRLRAKINALGHLERRGALPGPTRPNQTSTAPCPATAHASFGLIVLARRTSGSFSSTLLKVELRSVLSFAASS
jgi:hypothetical protein